MEGLDFQWISAPEAWLALLTLTVMEIVLGIDNVIFISLLVEKLPEDKRTKARRLGLGLAMLMRILLLLSITWVMTLTKPLFSIPVPAFMIPDAPDAPASAAWFQSMAISGKDLILLLGGIFLIWKSTKEIHHKLEENASGLNQHAAKGTSQAVTYLTYRAALIQIIMLDIVFSLDSVITAVGMAEKYLMVMIIAVMISVGFMLIFSGPVSRFVSQHPTVQMLALSFLILIGTMLIAEGFHVHVPKGYIYFAMAFSVGVEMLNLRLRKKPAIAGAGGVA